MLKILDDNIVINSDGISAVAESSEPFNDFSLSTYDKISLITDSDDLFISVEDYKDGDLLITGHTQTKVYPYVLTEEIKNKIKEDIKNVVKSFVQKGSSC